jgi:hypothetical protein
MESRFAELNSCSSVDLWHFYCTAECDTRYRALRYAVRYRTVPLTVIPCGTVYSTVPLPHTVPLNFFKSIPYGIPRTANFLHRNSQPWQLRSKFPSFFFFFLIVIPRPAGPARSVSGKSVDARGTWGNNRSKWFPIWIRGGGLFLSHGACSFDPYQLQLATSTRSKQQTRRPVLPSYFVSTEWSL